MRPTRAICSIFVAAAAAIVLLTFPALAQSPAAGATSSVDRSASESIDRSAGESTRAGSARDVLARPPLPVRPAWRAGAFPVPAGVGLVPTDIFDFKAPARAIGSLPVATSAPSAAGNGATAAGDNEDATLARRHRNPVSSLASISFENNIDFRMAENREGFRYTMNLEPVFPISINKDWNLISRTTMPFIQQDGIVGGSVQTGFGDILQSVVLAPSKTEPFFWGAGGALLIPTASNTLLGAGKLGLGPTVAVGGQQRAWTYGAVARHVWSVAGHRDRLDVRYTFVRPFVSYTTRSAWTYSLDAETTYDWVGKEWSAPIHFEVTKVVRFITQPVSVGAAVRCWAASPAGGPQSCGVRFSIAPLFPSK